MGIKKRFAEYYEQGYMPWVHKNPDFNLVEMVEKWPIKPCKTLEMGCGTGIDAIWLASQNFDVTACDISEKAIEMALKNLPETMKELPLSRAGLFERSNTRKHLLILYSTGVISIPTEQEETEKGWRKR